MYFIATTDIVSYMGQEKRAITLHWLVGKPSPEIVFSIVVTNSPWIKDNIFIPTSSRAVEPNIKLQYCFLLISRKSEPSTIIRKPESAKSREITEIDSMKMKRANVTH